MVGSLQSFQAFRASAYTYLRGMCILDVPNEIAGLYNFYKRYNPLVLAPKQPLAGTRLCQEMIDFIDSVGNRFVRVQSDNWSVLDAAAARLQYARKAHDATIVLTAQQDRAARSYLHVYPTGSTNPAGNQIQLAAGHATNNNWRIGINVVPADIAVAARRLMPIMDRYNEINHIKFAAPTLVSKPDSVIVYLRQAGNYGTILGDVQGAINGVTLQGRFAPMWNELAPGLAEAGEPPRRGGSFGKYRCFVTYLAWLYASDNNVAPPSQAEFFEVLDYVFGCFGIPATAPHRQQAIGGATNWAALDQAFFEVVALSNGLAANAYAARHLANR